MDPRLRAHSQIRQSFSILWWSSQTILNSTSLRIWNLCFKRGSRPRIIVRLDRLRDSAKEEQAVELGEATWSSPSTVLCRPWTFRTREWEDSEKTRGTEEILITSRLTPLSPASPTFWSVHLHNRLKIQRILEKSGQAERVQTVSRQSLRKLRIQWSRSQVVKSRGKSCRMLRLDFARQSRILKPSLWSRRIFRWFQTVIIWKPWKWGWRAACHQTRAAPSPSRTTITRRKRIRPSEIRRKRSPRVPASAVKSCKWVTRAPIVRGHKRGKNRNKSTPSPRVWRVCPRCFKSLKISSLWSWVTSLSTCFPSLSISWRTPRVLRWGTRIT